MEEDNKEVVDAYKKAILQVLDFGPLRTDALGVKVREILGSCKPAILSYVAFDEAHRELMRKGFLKDVGEPEWGITPEGRKELYKES